MIEWVGCHAATDSSYSSVLESPNMPLSSGLSQSGNRDEKGRNGFRATNTKDCRNCQVQTHKRKEREKEKAEN